MGGSPVSLLALSPLGRSLNLFYIPSYSLIFVAAVSCVVVGGRVDDANRKGSRRT